jgi:hypothetical protein
MSDCFVHPADGVEGATARSCCVGTEWHLLAEIDPFCTFAGLVEQCSRDGVWAEAHWECLQAWLGGQAKGAPLAWFEGSSTQLSFVRLHIEGV